MLPLSRLKKISFALLLLFLLLQNNANAQSEASDADVNKVMQFFASKGIDLSSANTLALYEEVYNWLNTKYKFGAQSETSTDCSGFAGNIYKRVFGQNLERSSRGIFSKCEPVNDKTELKEGDLLFFKIKKGIISHVAVFLQNGKFAHAAVHGGVRIDSLESPYYKRTFFKGGRLNLLEPEE